MAEMRSGTGCACVHFDRFECSNVRYRRQYDRDPIHGDWDACDCDCHDDYDEECDDEAA